MSDAERRLLLVMARTMTLYFPAGGVAAVEVTRAIRAVEDEQKEPNRG